MAETRIVRIPLRFANSTGGKPRCAPSLAPQDRSKFFKSMNILKGRGIKTIYPGHGAPINTSEIIMKF